MKDISLAVAAIAEQIWAREGIELSDHTAVDIRKILESLIEKERAACVKVVDEHVCTDYGAYAECTQVIRTAIIERGAP